MKTADYDFHLPEGLIALRPAEERDASKLLVLGKDGEAHARFSDLPRFLSPGDLLVINNTKVFPARLSGRKPSGGRLDMLLVREISPGEWEIVSKGKYTGSVEISGITARIAEGSKAVFDGNSDLRTLLWKEGLMPLPPYIRRRPDALDRDRYQTVYAAIEGSIAAPTAGLHFTPSLLRRLTERNIEVRAVTLHVGTGTFRPIRTENLEEHQMDREYFELDPCLMEEIGMVKARGNRVVAVGTTTTRCLEAFACGRFQTLSSNGIVRATTDIFIREGYRPRTVDSLITNFHLPHSTPLMLTAAFAGREKLLSAYKTAISMGYRFFSYGDAMLVL